VVKEMLKDVLKLWHDEAGLATVECAVLVALVALGAVFAWEQLGTNVRDAVDRNNAELRETIWQQATTAARVP